MRKSCDLNPPDYQPSVESFDLAAALANPATAPKLEAHDTVRIFGRYDFEPAPEVWVGGEVRAAGKYANFGPSSLARRDLSGRRSHSGCFPRFRAIVPNSVRRNFENSQRESGWSAWPAIPPTTFCSNRATACWCTAMWRKWIRQSSISRAKSPSLDVIRSPPTCMSRI